MVGEIEMLKEKGLQGVGDLINSDFLLQGKALCNIHGRCEGGSSPSICHRKESIQYSGFPKCRCRDKLKNSKMSNQKEAELSNMSKQKERLQSSNMSSHKDIKET